MLLPTIEAFTSSTTTNGQTKNPHGEGFFFSFLKEILLFFSPPRAPVENRDRLFKSCRPNFPMWRILLSFMTAICAKL